MILGLILFIGGLGWGVLSVTLMAPQDRANASGYGQFVLAVPGLLLTAWPYLHPFLRGRQDDVSLDDLADRLASAVRAQWTAAASERGLLAPEPLPIRWRYCTAPVAGPITAATTPRTLGESFPPLPGLDPVTPAQLREGTHRMLHRFYGGLASGRLILAGGPGSGKSSAAILLLLEALTFRDYTPPEQRARVPVPVLFTLAGWDPDNTTVNEWLATKLTELLTGRHGREQATRLLTDRRVAVILDGLDEIPWRHRPAALRALAQQATFRLVLLTRTTELRIAAQHHILTGAVALELQPLSPKDADKYLSHGLPDPLPASWHQLLTTLTSNSTAPITRALNNPLTITLLRDVYQPSRSPNSQIGPTDELLDTTRFPTSQHITNHLLDHAITTAYTPKPGEPPPRYDSHTAHHTLTLIAQHLRDENTRDLAWWQIPSWIPGIPRALLTTGLCATATGFAGGLMFGLAAGSEAGLAGGLSFGLAGLLGSWLRSKIGVKPDWRSRFRLDTAKRGMALVLMLTVGLYFGLVGVGIFGPFFGLAAGVMIGTTTGFVGRLGAGLTVKGGHPKDLWRSDLVFGLVTGLVFGLAVGLMIGLGSFVVIGLTEGLVAGLTVGLTVALVVGLPIGLTVGLAVNQALYTAISQIYFSIRHHTPLRLGRFLMDAQERHLLRTVGPIYQFRHATLQDRLAPPATYRAETATAMPIS